MLNYGKSKLELYCNSAKSCCFFARCAIQCSYHVLFYCIVMDICTYVYYRLLWYSTMIWISIHIYIYIFFYEGRKDNYEGRKLQTVWCIPCCHVASQCNMSHVCTLLQPVPLDPTTGCFACSRGLEAEAPDATFASFSTTIVRPTRIAY